MGEGTSGLGDASTMGGDASGMGGWTLGYGDVCEMGAGKEGVVTT